MLNREKVVLRLLTKVDRSLTRTVFVKLVFLLRNETVLENSSSFYDFVPYKFGPFSFALYRDLQRLEQSGYVKTGDDYIGLCEWAIDQIQKQPQELTTALESAVTDIVSRYARMTKKSLVIDVYKRYPWFATNSVLPERHVASIPPTNIAEPAVYTAGYEGKSVDAFFCHLLKKGIEVVIDVRANPISRKYGFSGLRMKNISESLGLEYRHVPRLGVPGSVRTDLSSFASYQRLLFQYERLALPHRGAEIEEVAQIMCRKPSVLVCFEKDALCCHRSKLADAVANVTELEVVHL